MRIDPSSSYDAVVIGSGHNGLVAAAYLTRAGKSVLILEANSEAGGATRSKAIFKGLDARLSVYSYLVSLFPEKIVQDLGLDLRLLSRPTASWTPAFNSSGYQELLIRNGDETHNRDAFRSLTGGLEDYRGYCRLQEMQREVASVVWPSLTQPLVAREELQQRVNQLDPRAWEALFVSFQFPC